MEMQDIALIVEQFHPRDIGKPDVGRKLVSHCKNQIIGKVILKY